MMMTVKREVETVECEGLAKLLGEDVILMCMNYTYVGKLTGVNDTCVQLENASIVYETGEWSDKAWKDAQPLPAKEWYVQTATIESFAQVQR